METLRLTKHHALRNDFLVLQLSEERKSALDARHIDWSRLAERVCDRRPGTGIGSDGLILAIGISVSKAESHPSVYEGSESLEGAASVRMILYNADGSRAGMSGNGSACLSDALARTLDPWRQAINERRECHLDVEITTDTDARSVVAWSCPYFETPDEGLAILDQHVFVDMPLVMPGPDISPALQELISERFGDAARNTGSVGNPHLVIAAGEPVGEAETAQFGELYEKHFADGINVEFIWPIASDQAEAGNITTLGMSVWERGAGLTQACGTGAVVSSTLARDWGVVDREHWTRVRMPGGTAVVAKRAATDPPQLQLTVEHIADIDWPLRGPWLDA